MKRALQRSVDPLHLSFLFKILVFSFAVGLPTLFAEQEIVFRSHDPILGFFYEIRSDSDYNRFLYVYRNRAGALGPPVFTIQNNIFSVFHSPDGKFLVVNFGSSAYGNVATVFSRVLTA
jgi:hypothetical protein